MLGVKGNACLVIRQFNIVSKLSTCVTSKKGKEAKYVARSYGGD
jgi:hypothetical protein